MQPPLLSVEEELTARLAGVARSRRLEEGRIRDLCRQVDSRKLVSWLDRQRVLGLLGTRLIDICPELVPPEVAHAAETALAAARHRHTLNAYLARDFCQRLAATGITAVPIKGPLMAERIHADPALRAAASDLDFLVSAEQLDAARDCFHGLGYMDRSDTIWSNDLPHYHYGLSPGQPSLPKVELHWRVHWYEKEFVPRLIARSSIDANGIRVPGLADDLAVLLIIFARDGFVGLKLAADISAWWDVHEGEVTAPILDPILEESPRLRPALLAALDVAQELIGLPRNELISDRWDRSHRAALAPRLLNWRLRGTGQETSAKITLIDLLLTPVASFPVFLRHYYFQPLPKYISDYGWNPRARLRNEVRRAAHALARMGRSAWGYVRLLWTIRRGTSYDLLPTRQAS